MRGKRSFLCGRDTRTHILRYGLDDEAARSRGWSLRPIRDDRKRNTAEFLVPRANAPYRRTARRCSKGTSRQASLTEKNSFFLTAKEQKAESRGGATRRGAPRSARKNIIYVRHDGRPIARRFTPRPLFVLVLSRSGIIHADGALNSPRYLKFCTFRFLQLS